MGYPDSKRFMPTIVNKLLAVLPPKVKVWVAMETCSTEVKIVLKRDRGWRLFWVPQGNVAAVRGPPGLLGTLSGGRFGSPASW